jgi:hypothetical protein
VQFAEIICSNQWVTVASVLCLVLLASTVYNFGWSKTVLSGKRPLNIAVLSSPSPCSFLDLRSQHSVSAEHARVLNYLLNIIPCAFMQLERFDDFTIASSWER